jgi:hypothetical protein
MAQARQFRLKHARRALLALLPALLLGACARQEEAGPETAMHDEHAGHDMARASMPADPVVMTAPMTGTAFPVDQPLVDIDGVAHGTLADPSPARWTGLIFVRTDCPVSNQYAPEIKRICSEYASRGMQCLLVYADPYDTIEAVRRHHAEFGYSLPAVLDPGHALVARAGATITPEAAVFTPGATLAYSGRIDNLYNELGRPRQQVTERDLRNALDDLIAGRTVRKPRTPATGCFIE